MEVSKIRNEVSTELTPEVREIARERLFERVRQFENKYVDLANKKPNLYSPVSKTALYNYALSLLNVEFYKLNKEDRELVLKQYE